jgi:hypothetical protein
MENTLPSSGKACILDTNLSEEEFRMSKDVVHFVKCPIFDKDAELIVHFYGSKNRYDPSITESKWSTKCNLVPKMCPNVDPECMRPEWEKYSD